ncbi:MAG: gamma-glutamylcyclotransferase family protein [Candidatus Hinthialibacter antarcticus]|nr:gamma-glutamylcyclotransferase family protein [Candidatus Hinthialibacter antarcticus]
MGDTRSSEERAFYFAYCVRLDAIRLDPRHVACISSETVTLPDYCLLFNVLEDHDFIFECRGLANIVPTPGASVEGVLYEISTDAIDALDAYVGVDDLKYYRKPVRVHRQNGCGVSAFTYAAWPDKTAQGLRPHDGYLHQLVQAAKRHGCSQRFLSWLSNQPTCV